MTRGKNFFRMIEFSAGMPHDTVVDPDMGNIVCRLDAGTTWYTESQSATLNCTECESSQADKGGTVNEAEVHGPQKTKQIVPRMPANSRISSLKKTKIKLGGKISELISTKLHKVKVRQETRESPVEEHELDIMQKRVPLETAPEHVIPKIEDEEAKIPDVNVQIVPTPVKKPRSAKIELAVSTAKPLKVIRRRREEAPKIFETTSKDFPKSMLEGIKSGHEEERDFPSE